MTQMTHGRTHGSGRRWLRPPIWLRALISYVALALLMTWPLALHLGDRFPGENPVDAWIHFWNIWWFKTAVTSGQNPYQTPLLFAPEGANLLLHTLAPFNDALGLLPMLVAGLLVAYNLVTLATIAFAGLATFWLARQVVGHVGAAWVAGLAFAASPYLIGHLDVGHLNVAALGWLPLCLLGLLWAAEGRRGGIPLAALCLAMTALCEWQTTLVTGLAGVVLVIWQAARAGRSRAGWQALARMVAALLLGALLLAPLVIATAQAVAEVGPQAELGNREAERHSANLLAYLLPQDLHPWWGAAVADWRAQNLNEVLTEDRLSLGLIGLGLAGLGLLVGRRRALPWAIIGGLGLMLALGPTLHWGQAALDVTLPYDWFRELPYIDVSRNPARFSVLLTLAVAILAAFGARRLALHQSRRLPAGLTVTLVGLLLTGELLSAPFPLSPLPDTDVATRIGRELAVADPEATILTLPYRRAEEDRLFHQVYHQRPIFGGFLPRDDDRPFLAVTPGFADLMLDHPYEDIFTPPPNPLTILNYYHVRYVLFYKGEVDDSWAGQLRANLRRVLQQPGPALVAADDTLEAWRLPRVTATEPFARIDDGWYPTEQSETLATFRWMGNEADLVVERPQTTALSIDMVAQSYAHARQIAISVNDTPVQTLTVGTEPTTITLQLPSGQGSTTLTLRSLDGADRPSDLGPTNDDRQLSVALSQVQVRPAGA